MIGDQFQPGDRALITSALGTHSLIGSECEVLEVLIDSAPYIAFNGQLFRGACDGSLSAFVMDLAGGEVWFFDCKRLMPLRGEFASAKSGCAADLTSCCTARA